MTAAPWPATAVDAVAEQLSADYDSQRAWVKGDEVYREAWRVEARVLLGLPAVVRALTEARADELEQAASEQDAEALRLKLGAGSHRGGHECAADHLRDRATSLRASIRQTDERNDR